MPLKENTLFGTQVLLCFKQFVFVNLEPHQQNKKPKMYLISKESFLLENTYIASARRVRDRERERWTPITNTPPHTFQQWVRPGNVQSSKVEAENNRARCCRALPAKRSRQAQHGEMNPSGPRFPNLSTGDTYWTGLLKATDSTEKQLATLRGRTH